MATRNGYTLQRLLSSLSALWGPTTYTYSSSTSSSVLAIADLKADSIKGSGSVIPNTRYSSADGGVIVSGLFSAGGDTYNPFTIIENSSSLDQTNLKSMTGTAGDRLKYRHVVGFISLKFGSTTNVEDWGPDGSAEDAFNASVSFTKTAGSATAVQYNMDTETALAPGFHLYTGPGIADDPSGLDGLVTISGADAGINSFVKFYVDQSTGNFRCKWSNGDYSSGEFPIFWGLFHFGPQWITA